MLRVLLYMCHILLAFCVLKMGGSQPEHGDIFSKITHQAELSAKKGRSYIIPFVLSPFIYVSVINQFYSSNSAIFSLLHISPPRAIFSIKTRPILEGLDQPGKQTGGKNVASFCKKMAVKKEVQPYSLKVCSVIFCSCMLFLFQKIHVHSKEVFSVLDLVKVKNL